MQKPSDFLHAYIHKLNDKEIYKLRAMLEADKKAMELKLLDLLRISKEYNEPALVKASKIKKASFQTAKSELKNYMLSTGGYQDKVFNQILLESIGVAQGLMRRGLVEKGEEELRRIDVIARSQGASMYGGMALSLIVWSNVVNQKINYVEIVQTLDQILLRMDEERQAFPPLKFNLKVDEIVAYDSGLRKPHAIKKVKELLKDPILKSKTNHTVFSQGFTSFSKANLHTLLRDFKKAIEAIESILLSARYPKTLPKGVSFEIAFTYERQSYNALRSKNINLINQYTNRFINYIDTGLSKVDALVASSELHQCWFNIRQKNTDKAQQHFNLALSKFNSAQNRITKQQIYDFLTRAMLISLNLNKASRYELMKLVVKYSFEHEWNEAYDMNFKILSLYTDWDETVMIRGGNYIVKDDSLAVNAARLKDNIRKKHKYDDYEFELGLCTLFLNMKKGIEQAKIHSLFKKFINTSLSAENLEKKYVKQYFDYFDFKKWAENIADATAK